MSNTWGTLTWGDGPWGEQGNTNVSVTTAGSLTSAIGSVVSTAELNSGWGRDSWGNGAWGVAYSAVATGQALALSQGTALGFTDFSHSASGQSMSTNIGQIGLQIDGSPTVIPAEDQLDASLGTITLVQTTNETTTGQSMSMSVGIVVAGLKTPVDVTGSSMTMSQGSISLVQTNVQGVTGQSMSMSVGTADAVSVAEATGSSATMSIGTALPVVGASPNVTGQTLTLSVGTPTITAWSEVNVGTEVVWTEVDRAA
jgi:hypothetical protein|tara:strand:+ start:1351 stop:2118 length:768 start_codon:yes stop_codon:yes gene_type:complete